MKRTVAVPAVIALSGLLGLTACAAPGTNPTAPAANNVAAAPASSSPSVDLPPEPSTELEPSAPSSGGGGGEASPTPVPSPTVAKTQKWVKIFSGPSQQDITPPSDITAGSKTVELNATDNDDIGTYVADGAGRTLYRFDEDDNKPPKATCTGDCAETWPPLLIKSPGKVFPDGVDPQLIGYVETADGHCQITINGWPVYYFSGDEEPGDINGQGVKGTWFAVNPDGGKTQPAR